MQLKIEILKEQQTRRGKLKKKMQLKTEIAKQQGKCIRVKKQYATTNCNCKETFKSKK